MKIGSVKSEQVKMEKTESGNKFKKEKNWKVKDRQVKKENYLQIEEKNESLKMLRC